MKDSLSLKRRKVPHLVCPRVDGQDDAQALKHRFGIVRPGWKGGASNEIPYEGSLNIHSTEQNGGGRRSLMSPSRKDHGQIATLVFKEDRADELAWEPGGMFQMVGTAISRSSRASVNSVVRLKGIGREDISKKKGD